MYGNVSVRLSGPIFDGRHAQAVNNFIEDAKWEIGAQASANVHRILDQRIKFPTPYYETQIIIQAIGQDVIVHDRDIIYGPWLEGISERNRTTRFKGYAAFRNATQQVESQVDELLQYVLSKHIGAM